MVTFVAPNASAAVTTFDNEAGYLAASLPTEHLLYDFETPAFPDASVDEVLIGVVNGIDFGGARVRNNPGSAVSGSQTLVGDGPGCCFGTTTIDFSGSELGPITGFGFFGLDLTGTEIFRLTLDFANGPDQIFEFGLDGAENLSPIFFGLTSSMDDILSLTIAGFRGDGTTVSPWMLITSLLSSPMCRCQEHCRSYYQVLPVLALRHGARRNCSTRSFV